MPKTSFIKSAILFLGIISFGQLAFCAQAKNSCLECHKGLDEKRLTEPANSSTDDAHISVGVTCVDCHGGDPSLDDMPASMDALKGFIGKPARIDIPKLCAKCHSDADYMKRYNPNIATDQFAKYEISKHGKLNANGDKKSAVCTSCHNAHNILPANNPASPTYALNVLSVCAKCHSDKEYMKEYGIPVNQVDDYKQSVHGQALLVKGDRSSPSCKSCHGNHDASLPRAIYVGNICSQCHALTYELFSKSPHKAAHDKLGIPECEACHGNHKILKPSDDMLGTSSGAVCLKCHNLNSKGFQAAGAIKNCIEGLKAEISQAKELTLKAERLGMDVQDSAFDIDEANNSLTKSRTYIHSFSSEEVCSVVGEGKSLAKKANDLSQKAIANFNFRRKAYGLVILLIIIFSCALYLLIKLVKPQLSERQ